VCTHNCGPDEAHTLVAALLENNVLELLVQRLSSFNEKVGVCVHAHYGPSPVTLVHGI